MIFWQMLNTERNKQLATSEAKDSKHTNILMSAIVVTFFGIAIQTLLFLPTIRSAHQIFIVQEWEKEIKQKIEAAAKTTQSFRDVES